MRVLYLEDNPADVDLTRRALARRAPEIEIEVVTTLAAAIERLSRAPRPDLLLSDLRLRDGTGLDALAHVRRERLDLPVVILTGSGDPESAIAALRAGADDYLQKQDDYLDRLPRALEGARARFRAAAARRGRPVRVLYAEPSAADRELTRRALAESAPHLKIDFARTAAEATEILSGPQAAFDVLLLDYHLPDADGLSLARALRDERGLSIPVVLVTGAGSADIAAQSIRLGIDDFLAKEEGYLRALPAVLERAVGDAELARERAAHRADLEERVQARTEELSRAMRAKDEFLASMSHELRTPLNAILGMSESLQEGVYGVIDARQRRPLVAITESGEHLLSLINDILDVAKFGAGKLSIETGPVDVERVGEASLRIVRQQAEHKAHDLRLVLDPAARTVIADERRLKQILVNLLANAVKFTPEGGRVTLMVRADAESRQMHFTVKDNGIGMCAEDQRRLFRPFVQLDSGLSRQHGGSGLGLSLVASLTELHRGRVSVESAPGEGSRFTVSLPWDPPVDEDG